MENIIQYGPYSPQEVDRITQWLKAHQLNFEIIRNDQEAKEALMNDGQNVVNLADLRTGIYLAQVFYINLKNCDETQKKKFEDLFCLKAEAYPASIPINESGSETDSDDQKLAFDSQVNHQKKRSWATFLSVLLILQIVIAFCWIILGR